MSSLFENERGEVALAFGTYAHLPLCLSLSTVGKDTAFRTS